MILQLLKAVGEWKVHIYWMINIFKRWKARFRLWTCHRKGWATAVHLWDKHSFTWTEVVRFSPSQLLPSCVFLTALTSCIPSRASCCSSSCTPSFICWEMEYSCATTGSCVSVAKTLQCRPMVVILSAWKYIAVTGTCMGMQFSTWQTHGRLDPLSLLNHGLWSFCKCLKSTLFNSLF